MVIASKKENKNRRKKKQKYCNYNFREYRAKFYMQFIKLRRSEKRFKFCIEIAQSLLLQRKTNIVLFECYDNEK